jgi:hypothetical protein
VGDAALLGRVSAGGFPNQLVERALASAVCRRYPREDTESQSSHVEGSMAIKRYIASRNLLIADYEWLRRMMRFLDVQTEQVDRQLIDLEKRLPNDYVYPNDLPKKEKK